MTEEMLLAEMRARASFASLAEARSVLGAVLAALRSGVSDSEAATLTDEIGQTWADPLRRGSYQGTLVLAEFYRLVAWQQGRRLCVVSEQAQAACAALAATVSEPVRQRLSRCVPALAGLFRIR